MRIIDAAIDLGLPLQINSTISRLTLPSLEAMAARVAQLPLTLWALFFLIQTGRGANLEQVSAEECERVLSYLYDLSLTSPFGIKTTEAPHYQRIVWQREDARLRAGLPTQAVERRRQLRAPRSVNDGNGFVFIDHLGRRTSRRSIARTSSLVACGMPTHSSANVGAASSGSYAAGHDREPSSRPAQ